MVGFTELSDWLNFLVITGHLLFYLILIWLTDNLIHIKYSTLTTQPHTETSTRSRTHTHTRHTHIFHTHSRTALLCWGWMNVTPCQPLPCGWSGSRSGIDPATCRKGRAIASLKLCCSVEIYTQRRGRSRVPEVRSCIGLESEDRIRVG